MQSILKSTAMMVLLSAGLVACSSEHHETANAIEVVELAQNNAEALAPVAEPIQFDDENLPTVGSTADTVADNAVTDNMVANTNEAGNDETSTNEISANEISTDETATDTTNDNSPSN